MTNMLVINKKKSKKEKTRLSAVNRRCQILEKAHELCTIKGFAGTTLNDIAKEARVSRALIIQHFGSKEGVYEALVDFLFQNHPMGKDPNIKGYIEEKDDYGVFKAFCRHSFEHMTKDKKHSPLRLIFFSMLEKPDLYESHYQKRQMKAATILENYISMRISEGKFKRVNPHHVAVGFLAMLTQLLIQELTIPQFYNEKMFMANADTMIHLIVDGLKN